MYNAKVHLTLGGGKQTTYVIDNLGPQGTEAAINVVEGGTIRFNDVGSRSLPNTRGSWGVLISYRDRAWAFRYEGHGHVTITQKGDMLDFSDHNGQVTELTG